MKTILLVEDNPDDELLAIRALKKKGVIALLHVARDGEEAIDHLQIGEDATSAETDPVELPEVVLMDINLPGINGLEVLRRIREHKRTRHLPVVVLTSSLEPQDINKAYQLCANSYIRKSVDYTEFVTTLGKIADYWLELNQKSI